VSQEGILGLGNSKGVPSRTGTATRVGFGGAGFKIECGIQGVKLEKVPERAEQRYAEECEEGDAPPSPDPFSEELG